ncbi:TPA: hypothetical protein TVN69_000929 [Streptococcus equi subsp. zooepidemicus]|nr:hypothetical protein [Streptococcus equi subsp. zooepidemicus]HEL1229763.1 hypothetical protein [Streptococcus equi subsp. zooepidemicus]
MKFPNKVISYKESAISKFPYVLKQLEGSDLTAVELYKKVKNKVEDVREFLDILDCLYALNKIELVEGVLHYVS